MSKRTRKTIKTKAKEEKENIDYNDPTSIYENISIDEYKMLFPEYRLKSFTADWPFDENSSCNPKTLSDAGFFHIPTNESPDACKCFCCQKELDGWEPEDNPLDEHKKHSSSCHFLTLKKPMSDLTVREFLKLECERQKSKAVKYFHSIKKDVETQSVAVTKEIKKLINQC